MLKNLGWDNIFFKFFTSFLNWFHCLGNICRYGILLLLSPYLCFISFLYLHLYVLGDDAMISLGSFMQTKHVYVSWSTSELRVRLVHRKTGLSPPVKYFTDRSKAVPLLWTFYVFFCLVFDMHLSASVYMCIVVTCWERADLLALVCGV